MCIYGIDSFYFKFYIDLIMLSNRVCMTYFYLSYFYLNFNYYLVIFYTSSTADMAANIFTPGIKVSAASVKTPNASFVPNIPASLLYTLSIPSEEIFFNFVNPSIIYFESNPKVVILYYVVSV
jgi:hypothetical protein